MSKQYRVYATTTEEIVIDVEEAKEFFEDEWAESLMDGNDEETFIRNLIDTVGLQEINNALEFGESLRVYGDLDLIFED